MAEWGGSYNTPSYLVKGRFIFCAANNIDFLEDTTYGKNRPTLHGTVKVIYPVEKGIRLSSPDFTYLTSISSFISHDTPIPLQNYNKVFSPRSSSPTQK